MKEIILIHIGQAGVNIGFSLWEQLLKEHQIELDGQYSTDHDFNSNTNSLFYESHSRKLVPRCLYFDLDFAVINQIKNGIHKDLYNQSYLVSGKEDSADIFSRGMYTIGRTYLQECLDKVTKLAETCENLQAICITYSISGGTGSGFASVLLSKLKETFPKKIQCTIILMPSPKISNTVVEPYNSVMGWSYNLEEADITICFDNQALYNITNQFLSIDKISYPNINNLIASSFSSMTNSMRFSNKNILDYNFNDLCTNLIPYSRMHFLLSSQAPFIRQDQQYSISSTIDQLTQAAFDPSHFMITCSPQYPGNNYMACSILYNGDINPFEVYQSIKQIKNLSTVQFKSWVPTGLKIGINLQKPYFHPDLELGKLDANINMLSNSTAIATSCALNDHKFDLVFCKRAFVWWYVCEGQEEYEFHVCRENLAAFEKDFEEFYCPSSEEDFGEEED